MNPKIMGCSSFRNEEPESAIQQKIIQFCAVLGLRAVGYPAGIFLKDRASASRIIARMKREGLTVGFPDLAIFGRGAPIFMEVKKKRGKLSEEQKAWIEYLRSQGLKAFVCYSFEEAQKIISEECKK